MATAVTTILEEGYFWSPRKELETELFFSATYAALDTKIERQRKSAKTTAELTMDPAAPRSAGKPSTFRVRRLCQKKNSQL